MLLATYVTQKRKCKWDKVTDAEWIKQTIDIKDSTSFSEKVIGIKSWKFSKYASDVEDVGIRGKENSWMEVVVPCQLGIFMCKLERNSTHPHRMPR